MTTITATIVTNDDESRSISFDAAQKKQVQQKSSQLPPAIAAQVLTQAQQREIESDAYIQRAIELHENDRLEEACYYFQLAAQGENPVGQLMYGLSLRHGWGCKPNPKEAIVYLERAAAYAMSELKELLPGNTANIQAIQQQQRQQQLKTQPQQSDNSQGSSSLKRAGTIDRRSAMLTARKELVMALYELGMSFLKGWGVQREKAVAFNYFKLAADLGDADSQNETAQCFLDGVGTEKNAFEAARYYRMAAAQGASQFGNSWIWKPKYDQYCEQHAAAAAAAKKQREENQQDTTSSSSSSSTVISAPLNLSTTTKSPARGHNYTQSLEQNRLPGTGLGATTGGPPRQGRYNLAGDLISSSQLELKIKQAEKLTSDTVGQALESPVTGKKKHRWTLWGHGHHRRAPSTN
ncbi:hypothetical protein BGZ49_000952 [Haplosporangium sp. Z 27]|nr:hypothetical protein BGZ49_000952 [Haplosporangium sp. Z 27]